MAGINGKVVLVTGGGSGIGRAAAIAFGQAGAKVIVSCRSVESGEETAALVEKIGAQACFVRADVSSAKDVESLVDQAVNRFGRLDLAFNNAAMPSPRSAPTAEYPEEDWDIVLDTNLKSVFLCMKYEIRQMLRQGGGAIVNNASTGGLVGVPNAPAYIASKHGVVGLTRTTALEYANQNIRINAIGPGVIETPMLQQHLAVATPQRREQVGTKQPIGRLGRPEEVAAVAVFLCSDEASLVTGTILPIDGGMTAG